MSDEMDEYNFVAKGKLKLKTDSKIKKKKKSKAKKKEREALQRAFNESVVEEVAHGSGSTTNSSGAERTLTKAEQAFRKQQEKMRNKRIMEKASTTHKQRVAKFNEHLDNLSEHYDIPKVSWTK